MFGANDKESPQWLLGTVTRLHKSYVQAFFRAHGLTEITHPRLLFAIELLERQGQTPAQNELAQSLGVSPASIAVSLKRMEKSGLITRQAAENDSRRNIIRTTPKSRDLIAQCHDMATKLDGALFKGFSEGELAQLAVFLNRVIANLQAMGATAPDCPAEQIKGCDNC